MEPPPHFEDLSPQQEVEVFACYWLLAMAPTWRSTLYTFSDFLHDEVANAPHAGLLLRVAVDVLAREWQEPEFRAPAALTRHQTRRCKPCRRRNRARMPAVPDEMTSSFATSPTKFSGAGSLRFGARRGSSSRQYRLALPGRPVRHGRGRASTGFEADARSLEALRSGSCQVCGSSGVPPDPALEGNWHCALCDRRLPDPVTSRSPNRSWAAAGRSHSLSLPVFGRD
jgi:hypothetical protein